MFPGHHLQCNTQQIMQVMDVRYSEWEPVVENEHEVHDGEYKPGDGRE